METLSNETRFIMRLRLSHVLTFALVTVSSIAVQAQSPPVSKPAAKPAEVAKPVEVAKPAPAVTPPAPAKPAAPATKAPTTPPAATPPAATKPTLTSPSAPKPDSTKPAATPAESTPPSAENAAPGPLPGHSAHGEAFDDGPRQAAVLMPGTGNVVFPVSSKKPLVQEFINQGVGQIHGFWYFEAERSFRQAAALDPDCATAYWGMAMANVNNEKRAKAFIAEAVKRKAKASPYEVLWIDALNEFYADPKKKDVDRRRQYVRRLETIVHDYPDDLEAKAFLVLQIWTNSSKQLPITSHESVDALAREIHAKNNLHPAHHYRIHLWDSEKASRALYSAAWGGPSGPGIAHLWHMPGHIYSNLKRYDDASWQQEAATRVDHAYMMRTRVMPDQIHNYAHNHEWLIRNLSFLGQPRKAIALSRNLIEMPRHPKINSLGAGKSGSASYGRMRLIELAARYELYDEVIAAVEAGYLDALDDFERDLSRVRLLGAAYFAKGNKDAAMKLITATQARIDELRKQQADAIAKAEKDAKDKKKPDAEVTKAKTEAGKPIAAKLTSVEQALASLKGHEWMAQTGDKVENAKKAVEQFGKAGQVSKELLSRVNLSAGDKAKAEQLALEAKNAAPSQVQPLANYVDILNKVGKSKEAKDAFVQLRELARHAELDWPLAVRLKPLAESYGWEADWRFKPDSREDIGPRPDHNSLGPVAWSPVAAPSFQLPDADGKLVSIDKYRGKPVVLIFYLGFGCVHCVEQLRAFKPMTAEFEKAGIAILAVTSDSTTDLKKALVSANEDGKYPFPIVSDSGLQIFKAYRAFDDFEKQPLHATIVLDGIGNIRWQDIGYEPFSDAKFLLGETRRLVGLGKKSPTPIPSPQVTAGK